MVKIIRRRNEHLNKRDCSHRLLLQSIDSSIRKGAKEATWIPSHAERRKKNRRTWTKEDWGNHLADKVAEGDRQHVVMKIPSMQWTAVDAITAISTLPEEGELYIGDWAGHPWNHGRSRQAVDQCGSGVHGHDPTTTREATGTARGRPHTEPNHTRHRPQADGDISQYRPTIMVCHTSATA